jgi:hypothetical protein
MHFAVAFLLTVTGGSILGGAAGGAIASALARGEWFFAALVVVGALLYLIGRSMLRPTRPAH